MTQTKPADTSLSIDEMPWPELLNPPPTDLPYDNLEAELRALRGEETQP
jgi:hypothetical protein